MAIPGGRLLCVLVETEDRTVALPWQLMKVAAGAVSATQTVAVLRGSDRLADLAKTLQAG
ncbi:hypothetical protein [Pseudoroseicyclus aestuarii]|uniref:Uncharacterized protein n=1 Tax=Pseudoroseicyclus aestuarii TaxID=1795041 RepID=A0A318SVR1_9RHOB|nr:hypothetical protein [Pseudoroseicyclus aestuarii]PYE85582.1 hypothetical protein DFP88_101250 [Pseudoroseicyclus aestuarii]